MILAVGLIEALVRFSVWLLYVTIVAICYLAAGVIHAGRWALERSAAPPAPAYDREAWRAVCRTLAPEDREWVMRHLDLCRVDSC